jgi:hypothetical protein
VAAGKAIVPRMPKRPPEAMRGGVPRHRGEIARAREKRQNPNSASGHNRKSLTFARCPVADSAGRQIKASAEYPRSPACFAHYGAHLASPQRPQAKLA